MKKMKKIMAALLAMVMMFAMTMTSFAAKEGASIKVKGLSTEAGQKVDIYEIYRLDANDNGWVKASWVPERRAGIQWSQPVLWRRLHH